MGVPQNGWLEWKTLRKGMILGHQGVPSGNQTGQWKMYHVYPVKTSMHRGFSSQPCLSARGYHLLRKLCIYLFQGLEE